MRGGPRFSWFMAFGVVTLSLASLLVICIPSLTADATVSMKQGTIEEHGPPVSENLQTSQQAGDSIHALKGTGTKQSVPDTFIDSVPSSPLFGDLATFEFSSVGASTFECAIDDPADFAICSSPAGFLLNSGTYTFLVRSVHASSGQADPTPATHLFTVGVNPVSNVQLSLTKTTSVMSGSISWTVPLIDPSSHSIVVLLAQSTTYNPATDLQIRTVSSDATSASFIDIDRTGFSNILVVVFNTRLSLSSASVGSLLGTADPYVPVPLPPRILDTFSDTNFTKNIVLGTLRWQQPEVVDPTYTLSYEVYLATDPGDGARLVLLSATPNTSLSVTNRNVVAEAGHVWAFFRVYSVYTLSGYSVASIDFISLHINDNIPSEFEDFLGRSMEPCGVSYGPCVRDADKGLVMLSWTLPNPDKFSFDHTDNLAFTMPYTYELGLSADSTTPITSLTCTTLTRLTPDFPAEGPSISTFLLLTPVSPQVLRYTTIAKYTELVACGFVANMLDPLLLKGFMVLEVTDQRTMATTTYTLKAVLQFAQTTHAASLVSITTQVLTSTSPISTTAISTSTVGLFKNQGFLNPLTDLTIDLHTTLYIQHLLVSDESNFHMTLKDLFIAPTGDFDATAIYQFPTAEITLLETPSQPRRLRLSTLVPVEPNCDPCFLHVTSQLVQGAKNLDSSTLRNGEVVQASARFRYKR